MSYSITIKTVDKTYNGVGETALDAVRSIPKPEKVFYRGTVTISDGERKVETLMYPTRLRRLFFNKLFQEIQLKKLCLLMK